jgi:HEAT repeat protein
LIAVLTNLSEGPEVRKNAAEALGQIGDPRAVWPLVAALKDRDWRIRFGALAVADLIEDYRVLEQIVISALQDKEWQVRARAARAAAVLSELKGSGSFEILVAALSDQHPNVRARATEACADSKDLSLAKMSSLFPGKSLCRLRQGTLSG